MDGGMDERKREKKVCERSVRIVASIIFLATHEEVYTQKKDNLNMLEKKNSAM